LPFVLVLPLSTAFGILFTCLLCKLRLELKIRMTMTISEFLNHIEAAPARRTGRMLCLNAVHMYPPVGVSHRAEICLRQRTCAPFASMYVRLAIALSHMYVSTGLNTRGLAATRAASGCDDSRACFLLVHAAVCDTVPTQCRTLGSSFAIATSRDSRNPGEGLCCVWRWTDGPCTEDGACGYAAVRKNNVDSLSTTTTTNH